MYPRGMRRRVQGSRLARVTAIEVEEGLIPKCSVRGIDWHGECYWVNRRRLKRMMRRHYGGAS